MLATSQDVTALTAQMRSPSWQGEVLLITRAGDPRPVVVTLSTATAADGAVQRIGVFRDVSREHELRFRLIREQKFRTLGSLAAGVAHNINNRLTPVLGWTEMLLERLAANEPIDRDELSHALRVINQGASDSVETVRRLQDYSRPARVRGPEGVQLRDVLEQLLALTRPQWDNEAARRGIRYDIDLKAEPGAADPGRGQRDPRGAAEHPRERAGRHVRAAAGSRCTCAATASAPSSRSPTPDAA